MDLLQTLPLSEEEWEIVKKKLKPNENPLWKYWEEFVDDYLEQGGSRKTIETARSFLANILRNTEAVSIEYCNSPRLFSKLLKEMKKTKGFKGATKNKYRGSINTYFIWLEEMEYIKENKVRKIRRAKEESVEVYALTNSQIKEIFNYIYTSKQIPFVKRRNLLFFDLLRATGARRCELLRLKPSDIFHIPAEDGKPGGWVIRLHRAKQKGSIDYIDLPDWAAESYENYMEIRNKTRASEEMLFVSQSKIGTGLTDKGVIYFFEQMEKVLGYKITSRSFRTYVATRLMEEGVPVQDISFYLGHRRISTTLRYIKKTPLMHRRCSTVLKKQLDEPNSKAKVSTPEVVIDKRQKSLF